MACYSQAENFRPGQTAIVATQQSGEFDRRSSESPRTESEFATILQPAEPVRIAAINSSAVVIRANSLADLQRVKALLALVLDSADAAPARQHIVRLKNLHPLWVASAVRLQYESQLAYRMGPASITAVGNSRLAIVGSEEAINVITRWIKEIDTTRRGSASKQK